ncbi:hypothetical protein [Parafilimonas terrae]|jgi:hypothetical protein|uniref:hypothetical protein n=1 Tax=Parafilimonas terrae TaxID=1465490 RepID=UPI0011607198|nr:hypothetical protein [Parafilimonas terrae]
MRRKYKWAILFSLLTIPLLVIAIFFAGAGHGSYAPAIFLFPFCLISLPLVGQITAPFIVMAILQYPIYGFILDAFKRSEKYKEVIYLILFTHIALAITIACWTGGR